MQLYVRTGKSDKRHFLVSFKTLCSLMFISVFGFTGCRNSSDGCKKDTDCREGRVCSKGECIDTGVKVLNGDKTKKPDKKSVKTPDKIPPSNHIVTPIQPPIKSDPLGPILKNLNLNLDLDAPGGKISFRMKGMKNGVPAIEMCQKGKCSEVDMSDPDSMVDIMTKLMGSGNPTDLMSQFLKNFNNLGPMIPGNRNPGFPRPVIPNVNPRNPVISPSNPLPGGPYRSVKDILKDKNRAAGREAILGGMKPVNISLPDRVDFKTTGGVKIETTVNASVRTHLRKLAKISGTVIIRIKIQRVSGTLIRGELTELDFNN